MPTGAPICETLQEQHGLYSLLEKDAAGKRLRFVCSVVRAIPVAREQSTALEPPTSPSIKPITLTSTEGGYYFDQYTSKPRADHPDIQHDLTSEEPPARRWDSLRMYLVDDATSEARPPPYSPAISCMIGASSKA